MGGAQTVEVNGSSRANEKTPDQEYGGDRED